MFVPTDRAFRALLVQLGGPDKAEEKFQENPRLLSGVSRPTRGGWTANSVDRTKQVLRID